MTNINKKISIMFLIIFIILSTAFALTSNATETSAYGNGDGGFITGDYKNSYAHENFEGNSPVQMASWLIIQSLQQHFYDDGGYITLNELRTYYDVLCNQKGRRLPSEISTYLVGTNGDVLDYSTPNLNMNDLGKELYKNDNRKRPFESSTYTSSSLGFYRPGKVHVATPKEAYILAEMVKELETGIFYYDIMVDESGNKVRYDGSLDDATSVMIGDETIYIVDEQYVAKLSNGDLVKAQKVTDDDGNVYYRYYNNRVIAYEGSLRWTDKYNNGGGEYPNFEYENPTSSLEGSNLIPSGSTIYITGTDIVVNQDGVYYRAIVEDNNSYIQLAWWTTPAGTKGKYVADTPFSQEADAFEAYILQAAGVTSVDQLEYTTEIVKDENGNDLEIENAFKFDYDANWVVEGEYEYPSTIFEEDKQTYLVGPFALDYVGNKVQFGDREEVEFAGITGMKLYTDAQEQALVFGEDWEIVYLDGERTEADDAPIYPKSNEKTGGTIRINGTADVMAVSLDSVWVQIDPSYDESTGFNNDWKSELVSIIGEKSVGYSIVNTPKYINDDGDEIAVESLSDGAIKASVIGSNGWNLTINALSELVEKDVEGNPIETKVAIRVYAVGKTGKVSEELLIPFTLDPETPLIGSKTPLQLVQYDDSGNISASMNYENGMWIKGEWTLIGSVEDNSGIKSIILNNKEIINDESLVQEGEEDVDVIPVNGTAYKNYMLRIPVGKAITDKTSGKLEYRIQAREGTEQNLSAEETIVLNYDNKAPILELQSLSSDSNENKIYQSNGTYTVRGKVNEDSDDGNNQSGFSRIAMYFTRSYATGDYIVDPMISNGDDGDDNRYSVSEFTKINEIYWRTATAKIDNGDIIITSTMPDNVRVGGLCMINNVIYRIETVNGNTITIDKPIVNTESVSVYCTSYAHCPFSIPLKSSET